MYKNALFIASDHGGYKLKQKIKDYLEKQLETKTEDIGPHEYVETDDYPDFALPLAEKVAETNGRGILICRNGIGVCIAANKIKGIRAGIGYNIGAAESMIKDDNTNILCLAADYLTEDHALAVVRKWLQTEFSGDERHLRRLDKIKKFEEKNISNIKY